MLTSRVWAAGQQEPWKLHKRADRLSVTCTLGILWEQTGDRETSKSREG